MENQEGNKVKVVPNTPEGKCHVPPLSYDSVKEKGADGKDIPREGILTIDEARFFCEYCHWAGIES